MAAHVTVVSRLRCDAALWSLTPVIRRPVLCPMAANLQLRLAQAGNLDPTLFLHPANQVIESLRGVPDFAVNFVRVLRAVPVSVSRHVDSAQQDLTSTKL